jgi:flagellar motor protein MotB
MNHRLLLIVPLAAAIALSGCRLRGGGGSADTQQKDDSAELRAQLDAERQRNMDLENRLAAANQNGQGPTLGETGLAGGETIDGFEKTASGGLALPDDFAFAKGSADLNEAGQKAVESLAHKLNEGENAGRKVIVKGFTDDTPVSRSTTKEKYVDNWGLSGARAAAVVRALEKAGVSSDRLNGTFRGQLDPRAPGKDEADKAKNRRVEIYLGG